jgi:branched-subunit amino acid ABC-type transport system permease component
MRLAVTIIIILAIELPIVAWLYNKKQRGEAVLYDFVFNMITWSFINMVFVSFDGMNTYPLWIPAMLFEAWGFKKFLKKSWKKAIFISLIANLLSFAAIFLFDNYVPKEWFEPREKPALTLPNK